MSHRLYAGAVVGAAVSFATIPVGLAAALPIFVLMCGMSGACIAGLLSLVSGTRPCVNPRRGSFDELTSTENALVLGIVAIVVLTAMIPSALHAREAARRTMVKNHLRGSHVCHGNLVRLDENMRVVGISPSDCSACRIARESSPFFDQPLLCYVDATGHRIPNAEVTPEARRVADFRFRYLETERANGWWDDPRPYPAHTFFVPPVRSNSSPWRVDNGRVFVEFAN